MSIQYDGGSVYARRSTEWFGECYSEPSQWGKLSREDAPQLGETCLFVSLSLSHPYKTPFTTCNQGRLRRRCFYCGVDIAYRQEVLGRVCSQSE